MNTNTNTTWFIKNNILNTQLEKKFTEYNTLKNDRLDIRNIFKIADDKRKIEIIKNIDSILLKFNEIHEEVRKKQIKIIDEWVEVILANLTIFTNGEKVIDVLATLD